MGLHRYLARRLLLMVPLLIGTLKGTFYALLFAVPIFDTLLVVVSRLRRRLPVYQAGLDHTYHRLIRLGVSPNRAILTMHITALLIDCIAFILLNLSPLLANGLLALLILLGLGAIAFLDRPHLLEDHPYPSI